MDRKAEMHPRRTEVTAMMPRLADENASAFPLRVLCVSVVRFVQNKANRRMAQLRLIAGQEKGYMKRYELCVRENKPNFPGRACRVPVRASVGAGLRARPGQPRGVAPTTGPGAKQSQFPAALPHAGRPCRARQAHGPDTCARNTLALAPASATRIRHRMPTAPICAPTSESFLTPGGYPGILSDLLHTGNVRPCIRRFCEADLFVSSRIDRA